MAGSSTSHGFDGALQVPAAHPVRGVASPRIGLPVARPGVTLQHVRAVIETDHGPMHLDARAVAGGSSLILHSLGVSGPGGIDERAHRGGRAVRQFRRAIEQEARGNGFATVTYVYTRQGDRPGKAPRSSLAKRFVVGLH